MVEPVWRIASPQAIGTDYARFDARDLGFEYCPECDRPIPHFDGPLHVAVDSGEPARTASFLWSRGWPEPLVDPELARLLAEPFRGCSFHEIVGPTHWTNASTGRTAARLPNAFQSELGRMQRMQVDCALAPSLELSSLVWGSDAVEPPVCPRCGKGVVLWNQGPPTLRARMIVVEGVEALSAEIAVDRVNSRIAAASVLSEMESAGVVFELDDAATGCDVWRLSFDTRAILVSDRLKRFLESEVATNIGFLHCGYRLG